MRINILLSLVSFHPSELQLTRVRVLCADQVTKRWEATDGDGVTSEP